MSIVTKIYKYSSAKEANGYKGEDFSQYVLQTPENQDNLEDTLDTFNITLAGLPFRKEFAPKTGFIIELYDEDIDENGKKVLTLWNKPFHLIVESDVVEQPIISDDTYFNHHISLIEASADAQNRLVDNIAVTYKLQNVTLEEQPTYDLSLTSSLKLQNTPSTSTTFENNSSAGWTNFHKKYMIQGHKFEWVLPDWYNVEIGGESITPKEWWENNVLRFYQDVDITENFKTISFPAPMLKCSSSIPNSTGYRKNGYCSIDCVITDLDQSTNKQTTTTIRINPYSGDANEGWTRDAFDIDTGSSAGVYAPTAYGWIVSRWHAQYLSADGQFLAYQSKVAESSNSRTNRVISFDAYPNHSYSISFYLHNFNLSSASGSGLRGATSIRLNAKDYAIDNVPAYYSYARTYLGWYWHYDNSVNYTNNAQPNASINFQCVRSAGEGKIVFASAPPASAYDLFNKAQLTTQTFMKQEGKIVDETDKQIELTEEDAQMLKDTTIVENFYNQKNLWQVLMDIGKYIHARPKLRFGSNGKYIVDWKYYGSTNQKEDKANNISIYNSRFIEDYISAISSYVSNMVQLGGTIREIVAPKSSSEDYLVYNDVAEIKTSKNIIEIVEMSVINVNTGERRGLTGQDIQVQLVQVAGNGVVTPLGKQNTTGFIFEEGVYQLLDVSPSTSINKGYAIYYTLGTNIIKGLNYQLPTVNTGDVMNDYAIKNIIGCAFNMPNYEDWTQIKVNDYVFDITYRTKDTLRTDQTRPDLRKYIMRTPYDRIPQHNQFANQTDTVIDSVKYGNNIYGTLIRTGNTTYSKVEWVNDLASLKQSGELYLLNDEWYYVTKVKNTFFTDHIISEVDFSKDFNKLSQIIGIPSEPRFYEISEQSLIKREVVNNDFIVIGTKVVSQKPDDISYIQNKAMSYIGGLLMSPINKQLEEGETAPSEEIPFEYPRYAVTTFKNDLDKVVQQNTDTLEKQILLPTSCYSLENTLTIEWDTVDNFSAGDKVIPTAGGDSVNTAYNLLEPVKYCDKYGRADMFNFAILLNPELSYNSVRNLPENPIDLSEIGDQLLFGDQNAEFYSSSNSNKNKGKILLKDNREHICINYNLQALTDSDRFVLSAYLWQQGKKQLRLALLNEEVNKISNATIEDRTIAVADIPFTYTVDDTNKTITINIEKSLRDAGVTDAQINDAKAIVIYSKIFINDSALSSSRYFVIARNISGLPLNEIKQDWFISRYSKSMFEQQ